MPNPVTQFQIISKQPGDTAHFFSTLFGWTMDSNNPMGYRQIKTGSQDGIQGGIWPGPPQTSNFVQLFVAVDDVAAMAKKAEELGAKVLIPPTTLPEGGQMAVLLDPQGMSFGLHRG